MRIQETHTESSVVSPVFGSKQDAVQKAGNCLPDVSFELQASGTTKFDRPWKSGNIYSQVQVSNEARVHLGDAVTINNYYGDPTKAKRKKHLVA